MTGTVAPGKRCVTALKKRMCRVIESPVIKVVGGKGGEEVLNVGSHGWMRWEKRSVEETPPEAMRWLERDRQRGGREQLTQPEGEVSGAMLCVRCVVATRRSEPTALAWC